MSNKPHIVVPVESGYAERCVHYAGKLKPGPDGKLHRVDRCDAGIEYETVETLVEHTFSRGASGRRLQAGRARPCFKYESVLTKGCPACQFPSEEEIASREAKDKANLEAIMKARTAIIALTRDAVGVAGVVDCPVCGTVNGLRFRRAACNGHIHATCSTEGCVAWME